MLRNDIPSFFEDECKEYNFKNLNEDEISHKYVYLLLRYLGYEENGIFHFNLEKEFPLSTLDTHCSDLQLNTKYRSGYPNY